MATGLTVADNDISVGGRTVVGARMGRVQYGFITHTSDTALGTLAGGGSQMGAAVSMVIPAAGVVRVTACFLEADETEGGWSDAIMGIKVGSDSIIWGTVDYYDGAAKYAGIMIINSSVASVIYNAGWGMEQTNSRTAPWIHTLDIAGHGTSTGTQDVEVWLADNVGYAGEITITGTTTTARFLVEVIDGS